MNHHNTFRHQRTLVQAVALAVSVMSAPAAYAACTDPTADAHTVTCTEGSTYSNTASTSITNTASISTGGATSSVVQMTGNGSSFTNAGTLTNTSTYSNTGSNAGQKYGAYIAAPTATTETENVITNSGNISAIISDANMVSNKTRLNTAAVVGVGTDAEAEYMLTNSGTISATHNGIGRVNGVEAGGDVESMEIVNSGTITGTQSHNITKTTSTATSFQGTVTLSDTSTTSAGNIGVAAGIYAEEEVRGLTIENSEDGTITGAGTYASGIYTRAAENTIVNEGTITGTKIGVAQVSDSGEIRTMTLENSGTINGDVMSVNGVALRWWSLSNGEGTGGANIDSRRNINSQWGQADSTITNTGTINGNLYFSNGTHKLTNKEDATLTGNIDLDQRDTTCAQASAISGGCGTSAIGANARQTAIVEVVNTASSTDQVINVYTVNPEKGTVTSDITGLTPASVTHNTLSSAASSSSSTKTGVFTTVGTKSFTFENTGEFDGDITIRTASSSVLGGAAPVASAVTLLPTITGSGAGSTLDAPSHHIAGMGEELTIDATAGAGTVTVAPKSLVTVHKGEYFLVADSLTLTGGAAMPAVSNAYTKLVNWSIATNGDNNLVIGVASVNSAATVAGVSKESAGAIDALMTSTTSIGGALQSPTLTSAEIEKAGQQLRPEANNASMQASFAAVDRVSSVIGARQDEVRIASNGSSGVSTGEAAQGKGFWMQGFGFKGEQDKRGTIDGYSASTGGFALGADTLMGNGDFRIGAALSYASTGVDGEGANAANRTDIDSYQGTLYGSWNAGAWYVDASLGYGRHQYDTKRLVTVGLVTDTVTGSHDGDQYLAKIGGGYPMQWGKVIFTPVASATYVHLDQDGYTETGTAGAALVVNDTQTDSFRTGLGAKVKLPLSEGTIKTSVEARAIWNHEFADNSQDITARFAAGGASFTTSGVGLKRDSANLGLGLNMASVNGQTLSVNYDADVKSDYTGHTASVQFRYDF